MLKQKDAEIEQQKKELSYLNSRNFIKEHQESGWEKQINKL